MNHLSARERIDRYLSLSPIPVKLNRFLGDGTDGHVWETSRKTAVKALMRETGYFNERDTYLRLREWGVTEKIDGFWIPKIHGWDDELWVIEMDMMQSPPYIIDFAKVRIDRPPDFSPETLADNERRGLELFEHHWPEVKSLLASLESYQIYYVDPQPGNIRFADMMENDRPSRRTTDD